MADAKFYHVYLKPKSDVEISKIERKMNLALDWFKYDNNNWVVYSNAGIAKLITRYKPLVEPDGRLFICELVKSSRNGWMDKDFWEWLDNPRNN